MEAAGFAFATGGALLLKLFLRIWGNDLRRNILSIA
jgi:hypothetical protein